MKTYTKCKELKALIEFSLYNRRTNDEEYRRKHNAQIIECSKKRYATDPEYRLKRTAQSKAYNKKRRAADPVFRAQRRHYALLRNRKLEAQFNSLSSIEQLAILDFYIDRPKGYHVDHIYPIIHGGLHCLSNLQYLTAKDNCSKFNKIPPNVDIDGTIICWS